MGQCALGRSTAGLLAPEAARSDEPPAPAPPGAPPLASEAGDGEPYRWRAASSAEVFARFGSVFDRRARAGGATSGASESAHPRLRLHSYDKPSTATIGLGIPADEADALYARSQPAPPHGCDTFISHSWSSSRSAKHLALVYVHHQTVALLLANAAFLIGAVPAFLQRLGARVRTSGDDAFMSLLGAPCALYAAVLLFGHRLPDVLGVTLRRTCFLDRLCIHQRDAALKQQGVEQLGTAVRGCRHLLVLWSADYFERLWCIFELAIASRELGPLRIGLVPLWLPPFLLAALASNVVAAVSMFFAERSALYSWLLRKHGMAGVALLLNVTAALPSLGLCALLRVKVRSHERSMAQLATFSLGSARVSVETDRPIVESELVRLFGSTAAFEAYVRTTLLAHVRTAIGAPFAIPYGWMAFFFLPHAWLGVVDAVSLSLESVRAIKGGDEVSPPGFVLGNLVYNALQAFVLLPLALQLTCLGTHAGRRLPFGVGWLLDVCVLHALLFLLAFALVHSLGAPVLVRAVWLGGRWGERELAPLMLVDSGELRTPGAEQQPEQRGISSAWESSLELLMSWRR